MCSQVVAHNPALTAHLYFILVVQIPSITVVPAQLWLVLVLWPLPTTTPKRPPTLPPRMWLSPQPPQPPRSWGVPHPIPSLLMTRGLQHMYPPGQGRTNHCTATPGMISRKKKQNLVIVSNWAAAIKAKILSKPIKLHLNQHLSVLLF